MSERLSTIEMSAGVATLVSSSTSIIFGPFPVQHYDVVRLHIQNCGTIALGVAIQHSPIMGGDGSYWKTFTTDTTVSASLIDISGILSVSIATDNNTNYMRVLMTATATVNASQVRAFVIARRNF